MVSVVIVSHSAKIAEGVVDLARQMGGGEVAMAAAGGTDDPDDPIGTDAFRVKEAIEQVWSADGVLVLMDLGSAVMSAETALDFLEEPADPSRVLLCEAPLVEGAVAAVTAARIGAGLEEVAAEARSALLPKVQHLGAPSPDVSGGRPISSDAISYRFVIPNRLGLHLRPAARLVELFGGHDARVEVANLTTGAGPVPGSSLSRLSALGALQGHEVEVRAAGAEAERLLEALAALVAANLGDEDGEPVTPAARPQAGAPGTLAGIPASPGVAVGPARRLHRPSLDVPDREPASPEAEHRRLEEATVAVGAALAAARDRLAATFSEEAAILTAHLLILDELKEAALPEVDGGAAAERAWMAATEVAAAALRTLADPYQASRAEDVEAVGDQVLARLLGVEGRLRLSGPGVLVADDLTPAEAADLDPELVAGIVTAGGAATSHSAIIARALGIPAVVGVGALTVGEGTLLVVDGNAGTVLVDPSPSEVTAARRAAEAEKERRRRARLQASAPAITRDGRRIEVAANIGSVEDAAVAVAQGADGVGLLRTEFLFLDRDAPPSEEEQEAVYRRIAETLEGRLLVLRTLDVGGDKPLRFLRRPPEANPFLGVRGIRLQLAERQLLAAQLRAALRVGADHRLALMFPMVSTLADWEEARAGVAEAAEAVGGHPAGVQLGVMVEVPSLALLADQMAPVVDFFSIGTNDLTQYVMAAERGNPAVAAYADALHPAVLRLIDRVCRAAAEHDRWVGVCGELAADVAATPILVGLGVEELSMSPIAIPAVKERVRQIDTADAAKLARRALDERSAEAVRGTCS